jgi:hypothetical protein
MDLAAWFGSQDVFSTGEAAHIFGSGPVRQAPSQGQIFSALRAAKDYVLRQNRIHF